VSQLDNIRAKLATMEQGPEKEIVFEKLLKTYDDFYKSTLESSKSALNSAKDLKKSALLLEEGRLYNKMFHYGFF
jgi:hypothetical protein